MKIPNPAKSTPGFSTKVIEGGTVLGGDWDVSRKYIAGRVTDLVRINTCDIAKSIPEGGATKVSSLTGN